MKTTFVDLSKFEEECFQRGYREGFTLGYKIGYQRSRLQTITKLIENGFSKIDTLNILDCSEELYEKAYKLAHSSHHHG